MKHVVAISLVFFSLSHLAKAEQKVEGLRLLTERYCNSLQIANEHVTQGAAQAENNKCPFFLSYSQLTLIGFVPQLSVPTYNISNHFAVGLSVSKNAKNNSP